ncbi:ATP-binding protein [Enterobacteriaceae bacterium H18W14]|uniref:sensor histidine kinase n=1 Tax=Dryocola boscaweniae TaxID=2925397 RepID=UPI0022F09C8B|nr:HAMP domain-containing sensor histidine kinase [Dryocola boscaweniae]MCT4715461.1 ATP-binding protein [Dryocola boscaweniae]
MASCSIKYQLLFLALKVGFFTLILVTSLFSTYIYFLIHRQNKTFWPGMHESLMIFFSVLVSALLAFCFSRTLARKIITPLHSVAQSARKIANGQPDACADTYHSAPLEAQQLVNDFNSMAKKMATRLEGIKKRNAIISHELRTPVTILQGRLQGLKDGVFENSLKEFDILLHQTEGLSRLIDDLYVFNLADSGQLHIYREPVHLKELIYSCVNAFHDKLASSGIKPLIETEEMICFVDGFRIRQIFSALLSNACKYAVPGVLKITCAATKSEIVIRVEDEGPGLAADDESVIFDAFFRSEKDRQQKPDGSGLGLAVVQAIARAHGGRASYRRSASGGSCFEVTFLG